MQQNLSLLKYVNEKLETRYLMPSTSLRMETQKSANSFVKIYFYKNSKNLKNMILVGNFNINALDHEQNKNSENSAI